MINIGNEFNKTMRRNQYNNFTALVDKYLSKCDMSDFADKFADLNLIYIPINNLSKFAVKLINCAVDNIKIRNFIFIYLYDVCVSYDYNHPLELMETTYRKYINTDLLFKGLALRGNIIGCERVIVRYRCKIDHEIIAAIIHNINTQTKVYLFKKAVVTRDIKGDAKKIISLFSAHINEINQYLKK